jgi:type III restriction enzyme
VADQDFRLFSFQEEAAEKLRAAALNWVGHSIAHGVPRYGSQPIPFVGQLRAVTGSGKTPMLADIVSGVGDAVVIWTSKSAAVVEQTYKNLRGRYRSLLPAQDVRIMREIPSQADWQHFLTASKGLTIWVLTTAAWNELEAASAGGDANARLSLHRPQPDWSGTTSPWELMRTELQRPLWIVSDESHNQSSTQLEILANLGPIGFFLASATPVQNELFEKWREALSSDPNWASLVEAGTVPVRTRDVVAEELLKTTIELFDNNSGFEEDLDSVLSTMAQLDEALLADQASVTPKAIYVVEKSNPPRGSSEEARPVVIWNYLRSKGVDADQIAIYTNTKDVPEDAEKISSLGQLQDRHRHIIFNQALQEGWDDPEAYVAYFDGKTNSFVRIRQIIGRILRQPNARTFEAERLNTATVYINAPTDTFEQVLADLKKELRLYAPENEPSAVPIRVKTKKNPLPGIPAKEEVGDLTLSRWSLKAPNMATAQAKLRSRGASPWAQEFLDAPGTGQMSVLSLATEGVTKSGLIDVIRSARTRNGIFLRRRLLARNRPCLNAIHPDAIVGPGYEQESCQSSLCQGELESLISEIAANFEDRVEYQLDPDPDKMLWSIGEHRPRSSELLDFENAAHPQYSAADFNPDELLFARALDSIGEGVWMRNPASAELGYGIPLPIKVGDSSRFYPDFLWWLDGTTWAIDTTGSHLMNDKIRGKLIGLEQPRISLVVRGKWDIDRGTKIDANGWTSVIARNALAPIVNHAEDLPSILASFTS